MEGNPGSTELVEVNNEMNEEDEGPMVDMPCPEDEDLVEDTFFTGALGFGVMGDMCMYQNFDTLSLPCQSTITDLHELREQVFNTSTHTSLTLFSAHPPPSSHPLIHPLNVHPFAHPLTHFSVILSPFPVIPSSLPPPSFALISTGTRSTR